MGYNPGYVDGVLIPNNAAYVPGAGLFQVFDTVEGGVNYWIYVTSDSLAQVQAANYITDATNKRLKVGDIVDVFSGTLLSESASSPVGAKLGGVTFPATIGVSSLFASTPQYQRMIVNAVGVPTTTAPGAATLIAAEPTVNGWSTLPRNLIDCGDFTTSPWQINSTFNGNGPAPTLTADRWNANSGTSLVWTAGRASNVTVPGFSAAYQWGRSAGDTHTVGLSFGQVIETLDAIRVQGLPVALSFWNSADANFAAGASGGTFVATIVAGTGINESSGKMFSGAWSGMTTVATQVITPSTTMQRVGPIAGTVPTGATELGVAFSYVASAGTTAGTHESLQFMGIQLEVGSMTPFEHTEEAEVVNIATRYLQVISEPTAGIAVGTAVASGSSIAIAHIELPSPMRQAPTLTFTAGGFAVFDSALAAHTISAAGLAGATTGAITLTVTAAATLTAGQFSFMQGRSTGLGAIVLNSDF